MNWWHEFFDDEYAAYGLSQTKSETLALMCDVIIDHLGVSPGQTIFDQCCGIGRISLPLAERGFRMLGVDQSQPYIDSCRRETARRSLSCEFHHGDAFEFVTPRPCDGGINWFTSFGYLQDDSQNVRMLHRAFESLKPGATFMLDYLSIPCVFGDFRAAVIDRPCHPGVAAAIVLHENKPDFSRGMLDAQWTFLYPDGRRVERAISTRMFMPVDLVALFRQAGFEDVRLRGGYENTEFDRHSPRALVVGRKPA